MGKVMRIRELREAARMTQQTLGDRMGVMVTAVCNWESEVALPRSRQLPQLAHVLGCSINDLYVPDTETSDETEVM